MTKYICNKKIENSKFNEVTDLKDIGKGTWNFISAIYKSEWDSLITDNNNTSFRSKVSSKFTPKINKVKTNKSKSSKNADKPATFNRLPPLILAKCSKEVNEILKYFKRNSQTNEKKDQRKSYAQASSPLNNTREVLKIKEIFSHLQAKKIENIQKIINSKDKPKLRIHMITKEPSRKKVIVPMSNDNKIKFMKNSSTVRHSSHWG